MISGILEKICIDVFIAPEPEVTDAEIFHNPEDDLDHFEGDTTTTRPLLDLCKKRIATLPAVRGDKVVAVFS